MRLHHFRGMMADRIPVPVPIQPGPGARCKLEYLFKEANFLLNTAFKEAI
jgi:hypothetical protein